jgi:cyclopropane-fatty-acyl-phospholipid synthase
MFAQKRKGTMYQNNLTSEKITFASPTPTAIQKFCIQALFGTFSRIRTGCLSLHLPDGGIRVFGRVESGLKANIRINTYRFFPRLVFGGDVGFGEAYMAGEWDSNDITRLITLFIENRKAVSRGRFKTAFLSRAVNYINCVQGKNTLDKAREKIQIHYDIGNDFFRQFLDKSMTYSCGLFLTPQDTLAEAQKNKIDAVINKARIKATDHVLEIGCGWGSFSIEAAKQTGCRVTAITVSQAQFHFARDRVKREHLQDHIDILLCDYRQVSGRFDKIVSIEMLEAVGHEYFGTFFQCCNRLLKPDGLVVLQAITCPDQDYDAARKRCGWVLKHIFPGGVLPSLTTLCQAMTSDSDFVVENVENIGVHYARTLKEWRNRFLAALPEISKMGFDRQFLNKWIYFFSYCEAGFAARQLNVLQIILTRTNNKSLPAFP